MIKFKQPAHIKLWTEAERALTLPSLQNLAPEMMRTSGLLAVQNQGWKSALLRLEEAVRNGVNDLQTLDGLGEAAYQSKALQTLPPFQELYRDPAVAVHMARAYLLLGHLEKAREFLALATDSLLKAALQALLGAEKDIETAAQSVFALTHHLDFKTLNLAEYWQALAPIAEVMGRPDLVKVAESRLKALAYANPVVHFNQSLRFLAEGEFRAGWKLYDWRLVPGSGCAGRTNFAEISMWEGELLQGRRILMALENGFGDQIFSLRYLHSILQENPSHVDVVVGPELRALVHSSFPTVTIHDPVNAAEPPYWQDRARPDYWAYCFSVPARMDECLPVKTAGFLRAPLANLEEVRSLVAATNSRGLPVVGLVWHGDIRTAPMRTRAYSLQEFLRESGILQQPVVVVCLQKDANEDEMKELTAAVQNANGELIDARTSLQNFAVTAAWIQNLDHMWSCDTATAHLAGALGVDTTVLIRNKSIWHWRCDQKSLRSVWYDSCQVQYALTPKISYMFDLRP